MTPPARQHLLLRYTALITDLGHRAAHQVCVPTARSLLPASTPPCDRHAQPAAPVAQLPAPQAMGQGQSLQTPEATAVGSGEGKQEAGAQACPHPSPNKRVV